MAVDVLPRSWGFTRPPVGSQIIRGHSLARDLAGAWLFGGAVYDLTGKNPQLGTLVSSTFNQYGLLVTADGGHGTLRPSKLVAGETNLTMMAFAATTGTDAGGRIAYCERGSGGNDILKIGQRQSNAGAEFTWRNDGSTLAQLFGSRAVNDGLVHQIVGRQEGTALTLWVDGVQDGTGTAGAPNFTDVTLEAWAGGDKGDSSATWNAGGIVAVYVWRRALSDSEIRQLSVDPYAFFVPPAPYRRRLVDAVAAPAADTSKFFALF